MTAPPGLLPDLSRRWRGTELLDEANLGPRQLRTSLGHVAAANLRIGGLRSIRRHLLPLAREVLATGGGQTLSLLDVGVGNGEVPRRLAGRLSRAGIALRWTGIDLLQRVLDVARQEGSTAGGRESLVRGNAHDLPFADRSFDVVAATLTLHHFADDDALLVLAEMARVARHAVIVSDLERHPLNYLGARALAATVWRRDPVTRHDGPLSVLRSFTARELRDLGRAARFRSVTVRRHFPFRLVLEGRA